MKKFFLALALAFSMVAMQSCKDELSSTQLLVDLTAEATGQVEFTWPNGGAAINGEATIYECNDTTKVLSRANENVYNLQDVLAANDADAELLEAANEVDKLINVKGVAGNYHLLLKGYVKWGPFIFYVDEEYPKTEAVEDVEAAETVEAVEAATTAGE